MRYRAHNAAQARNQVGPGSSQNSGTRLFSAATLLARKGRYADATRLLEQARDAGECSETAALDLQARIYAQQGFYLYAESCWRRALSLDGSNTAYADALNRLRRGRRSIGSLYQLSTLCAALAVLSLLLWQIIFVDPEVRHREDAATQSLTAIRGDIAALGDGSESRDLDVAMTLSKVQEGLRDLDTQLVEHLEAMPTVKGTTENRDVIIRYLDEKIAALEKVIAQRLENIDEQQTAADAAQVKRLGLVESTVSRLGQTISGTESSLAERIHSVESAVTARIDAVESAIRKDISSSTMSHDVSALGRSLAEVKQQLDLLIAEIGEPSQTRRPEGVSDQHLETRPATQPAPRNMTPGIDTDGDG